jgi:hypothetical protein
LEEALAAESIQVVVVMLAAMEARVAVAVVETQELHQAEPEHQVKVIMVVQELSHHIEQVAVAAAQVALVEVEMELAAEMAVLELQQLQ